MHLILDATIEQLPTVGELYNFLTEAPTVLGMHRITLPTVADYQTEGEDRVAGIILLAESHISYHGQLRSESGGYAHGSAHVDVFSCRSFSMPNVKAYLTARLGLRDAQVQVFEERLDLASLPLPSAPPLRYGVDAATLAPNGSLHAEALS